MIFVTLSEYFRTQVDIQASGSVALKLQHRKLWHLKAFKRMCERPLNCGIKHNKKIKNETCVILKDNKAAFSYSLIHIRSPLLLSAHV